ncbi:MAG: hypothetical protein K6A69_06200 [Lachnospiraceae bacterium]|nr:hypothetical protein [Lachnospiraceae bacterium]
MQNGIRNKGKNTVETIIVSILVIIFFVSTVLMYYSMLFYEKRDNIIKDGRIAAQVAAEKFEQYMNLNSNFIGFTALALDDMIEAGRSDQEIQDFMEAQSMGVKNVTMKNTTGLYGYIRGKFYSGTDWVAPDGYDATERPWYKNHIKNNGLISVLEPYQDMQTGEIQLAIGKMLSDGESVVSVDMSIINAQEMTKNAVENGNIDIEMVLTGTGYVVTHSDENEVGKNYTEETGTLGVAIYDTITDSVQDYYELEYGDRRYIIYVAQLADSWRCVSVIDTTSIYRQLQIMFALTIVVVLVMVVIIVFIMRTAGKRGIMVERALDENEAKNKFLDEKAEVLRKTARGLSDNEKEDIRELGEKLKELSEEMQILSGMGDDRSEKGRGRFYSL